MKKTFARLLAILMVVCTVLSLSCVVFADGVKGENYDYPEKVKMGTPLLDGKLDNMYKDSIKVEFLSSPNGATGVENENIGNPNEEIKDGFCYILWDEEAMYFYCVTYDPSMMPGDKMTIMTHLTSEDIALEINPYKPMPFKVQRDVGYDTRETQIVAGYNTDGGYYYAEMKLAVSDDIFLMEGFRFPFQFTFWNCNDANGSREITNYITTSFFAKDAVYLSSTAATSEGIDETYCSAGFIEYEKATEAPADESTEPLHTFESIVIPDDLMGDDVAEGDTTAADPSDAADTTANAGETTAAASEKSGCGSVIGMNLGLVSLISAGAAVAVVRRRENH